MSNLFVLAAHNTIAALVLAILVSGLTRVWRHPPIAHVLWLLVLLKLVAPPLVPVAWFDFRTLESTSAGSLLRADVLLIKEQKADGCRFLCRSEVDPNKAAVPGNHRQRSRLRLPAAALLESRLASRAVDLARGSLGVRSSRRDSESCASSGSCEALCRRLCGCNG